MSLAGGSRHDGVHSLGLLFHACVVTKFTASWVMKLGVLNDGSWVNFWMGGEGCASTNIGDTGVDSLPASEIG